MAMPATPKGQVMGRPIIIGDPRLILAGVKVGHLGVPRDPHGTIVTVMEVSGGLQVMIEVKMVVRVIIDHLVGAHIDIMGTMLVAATLMVALRDIGRVVATTTTVVVTAGLPALVSMGDGVTRIATTNTVVVITGLIARAMVMTQCSKMQHRYHQGCHPGEIVNSLPGV